MSNEEKVRSSTWRELETVIKRILFSKSEILTNRKIKILSDNRNVKSILKAGSMKKDLQIIAIDIYDFCKKHNITIISEWITRHLNERADYLFITLI